MTVGGTDSLSLDGLGSGSTIPNIYIALVDKFGQIVGTDNSSTTSLTVNTTTLVSNYTPVLTGTTTKNAARGMFYFSDITFIAGPNSSYSKFYILIIYIDLFFESSGIDETKPSNIEYIKTRGQSESILNLAVSLRS